jgi:hypothetical protein
MSDLKEILKQKDGKSFLMTIFYLLKNSLEWPRDGELDG